MLITILLAVTLLLCPASCMSQLWDMQRDNLAEYMLMKSVAGVRSSIECGYLAEPEHQAVQFSESDGTCRMFSCQLGWSGCRKCRNARNSSLPLLMLRRLDPLGFTCWRTFQHRVDDSVDFYRNWTHYVTGFGQGEDRNYWMGLEAIHQLTMAGDRRVRWEMSLWNGSFYWWEDAYLTVQGSAQLYRALAGNQDVSRSNVVRRSTDPLFINMNQFSTPDRDHDTSGPEHCAVNFKGAWWYGFCHSFNPNGVYFKPPTAYSLTGPLWAQGLTFSSSTYAYPFNYEYSMMTIECMVIDSLN